MILIMEFDPSQLKNAQDQAKYETQTSLPRIISFKAFTFGLASSRNMIRISLCILFLNIFWRSNTYCIHISKKIILKWLAIILSVY